VLATKGTVEEFWIDELPVALATMMVVVGGNMPEAVGEKVAVPTTSFTEDMDAVGADVVAEAVDEMDAEVEADADAELDDEEVILNGNEYWKVEVSESSDSLNP